MPTKRHDEIKWIVKQVKPSLRLHLSSLACIAVGSLLMLLDPLIIKWLIDDILPHHRMSWVPVAAGAFMLTYAARLSVDNFSARLSFHAVQKTIFKIRLDLLRHLQRLPPDYHNNRPVGDTLYRIEQDVNQIGELGIQVVSSLLRILVISSLVVVAMCALNFRLACVILLFAPTFVLVRWYFHRHLRQCSELAQQHAGKMSNFLQEHLVNIVQVQLLSRELTEARRFARLANNATRSQLKRRQTELTFTALSAFIVIISITTILGYGGYQVVSGALSVGGLVAFYSYALQLFGPLYAVVDMCSKFQRIAVNIHRIREIAEADVVMADHSEAKALSRNTQGAIELKDVSFWYQPDRPVLAGINLRVRAGERIALVGTSGNGKSTIAKLVARLYDVREGAVLIDGYDVRKIKLKTLRSAVALVPQDPVLFDTTFRENLLYGNPHASQFELDQAVAFAQLEGLVTRLPRGWQEPVGPRADQLSGGERQRIALARTLLQEPRILILDEFTSALDASTERDLLETLSEFMRGRTVIVISHRLSTIAWADRVLAIDQGQIIEAGAHNPLYQSDFVRQQPATAT